MARTRAVSHLGAGPGQFLRQMWLILQGIGNRAENASLSASWQMLLPAACNTDSSLPQSIMHSERSMLAYHS
jgi:hypothetical protein